MPVRWIDAESEARKPPPRALVVARREASTMQRALVTAGTVYVVAAAAVVGYGQRTFGFDVRAAWFLAYSSSLTGVFLIFAFTGRDWRRWAVAGAGWFGGAFVLLVWPLHLTPSAAIRGIASSMDYAALPLIVVAPLALRIIRPLAVGFVPLVGLYFVCAAALRLLLDLFGISFAGLYTPELVVGGSLATLAGIAIAIRQIRRRVRPSFVFSLAAMLIVGLSWSFYSRTSAIAGAVGSIGANGLLTLLTWQLFSRVLHMKALARITDEVLHFSLCWFVLTALLPAMANTGWTSVPLVAAVFISSMATLFLLLRRQGRRLSQAPPARMLLLRVFAEEPLRNRLMDGLDDSWRQIGCVDLIVGTDLAIRSLSPMALEGFLLGRVHRHVLTTVGDAAQRIAVTPPERAVDGRYLLNEFHCSPDVWAQVVSMLARRADIVLIDLGGWNAGHSGATFELSLVVGHVPLSRIVWLADRQTDEPGLTTALEQIWTRLPDGSVNARLSAPCIEVMRCSGQRRTDAAAISNRIFAVHELSTPSPMLAVSN
ncbi:MAG: hypothetical protein ABI868_24285 [Acidobacteriota bacterium]